VFIVLAVFLELRLAFWVAMGIPISILGAGFILLITGQTMNMLTMFAFLMALGIVVDDAIVIGENIYAKREEGLIRQRRDGQVYRDHARGCDRHASDFVVRKRLYSAFSLGPRRQSVHSNHGSRAVRL